MIINSVISGGGGEQPTGDYTVKVIDYDGTVLLETKGNTGDVIELPTAPTHDKLVFQEWSASVAVTNNTVTIEDNDVMVGAVYTTTSGKSEFDITLTKITGLSVTLNMNGTKDWGDGTSDTATTHTYTAYGDYTITCDGTTMTTSSSSGLFGSGNVKVDYYCCVRARLANVTSIGNYAFYYSYSLKHITIPNSVTSIGNYAFNYCYALTSITIPSSVTSISSNMLNYCNSLKTVTIPNSVTSIGGSAFSACNLLTNITIPNSITSIGSSAFYDCRSLINVTIPSSISSMGTGIFNGCYSLINVTILSGVTSISNNTFQQCYSLTNVTIPNTVTSIGTNAFSNCPSLTSIIIPSGVTSIRSNAFYNCLVLKNITITNKVSRIEDYAFGYCRLVTKYDFSQFTSVPTLSNTNAFYNINAICKIVVPDSLYDSWIAATNWSTYADYIYKASEVQ